MTWLNAKTTCPLCRTQLLNIPLTVENTEEFYSADEARPSIRSGTGSPMHIYRDSEASDFIETNPLHRRFSTLDWEIPPPTFSRPIQDLYPGQQATWRNHRTSEMRQRSNHRYQLRLLGGRRDPRTQVRRTRVPLTTVNGRSPRRIRRSGPENARRERRAREREEAAREESESIVMETLVNINN